MAAKIAAGITLAIIGLLLVVFGVGFLSYALAVALSPILGEAGGAAVTGAIFVGPPVLWAAITLMSSPKPKPKPMVATDGLWTVLFSALARETPWIAVIGAVLVGVAEFFLAGRKKK
jgi:hypothetical protein